MSNHIESLLDRVLAKIHKSLLIEKPSKLTCKERDFLQDTPQIALLLITRLTQEPHERAYQEACLELLSQALELVRYNYERDEVWAVRLYNQIDKALQTNIAFLPREVLAGIFTAFYEARLELPSGFKEASLEAMSHDGHPPVSSLEEMRTYVDSLIESFFDDRPNLTPFELSDVLFQVLNSAGHESVDLMIDRLTESPRTTANEAAILFLLHPTKIMREHALDAIKRSYEKQTLTPLSLRRLVTIRQWWPADERAPLDHFIALQRKQGVGFSEIKPKLTVHYEASMVDGAGVQLILFEVQEGTLYRIGGLLLKDAVGVRDAWMIPNLISKKELRTYRKKMKSEHPLTLNPISEDYVVRIISHYLALNNAHHETPEPALLDIYEYLGESAWRAESLNFKACLSELFQTLTPTQKSTEGISESLQRSGDWMFHEDFTFTWFETSASIDAMINRHTTLHKGKQNTQFEKALEELCTQGFESVREKWMMLFLWMALMEKSMPASNPNLLWKDFVVLAYVLEQGQPMQSIPLMQHMANRSLTISVDSLYERGGYLL